MTVAVLGLFFLQFAWIRSVHRTTEQKFQEDVQKSMVQTAIDLEQFELMKMVNPTSLDQGLEGSLDDFIRTEYGDVIQPSESFSVRDTIIYTNGEKTRFLLVQGNLIDTATGLRAEHRIIQKDLRGIAPAELDNSILGLDNDTNSFAIKWTEWNESYEYQIKKKAYFLNSLIEKLFTTNPIENITLRLNLDTLDFLLNRNLQLNGIDTNYKYTVVNLKNQHYKFKNTSYHYDETITKADFSTLLFPNDIIPSEHMLWVSFPSQNFYVWKEMAGTLTASLTLVFIVMFAFYFAVRTIYQQKQLSEIKNDFISNMTHELKTPISTISLACEAIADPDVQNDRETVSSFIQMIEKENKRLGKLVENVLQTALIDKGKLKLNLESAEVSGLLKQVVESFQIRYHDKGGEITIDKADAFYWDVDKMHFANVIYNLLDNSLKYCEEKPHVHVRLEKIKNGFILEVADNGIGIKKEDQKRIFEKLYRVPTGDVHNVKGFGLGLSYVVSVVKLHNGVITIKSALGKGSTFSITFNL
jgi:two-component system phosphate regulon sensor histidine kinase PhoR